MLQQKETGEPGIARAFNPQLACCFRKLKLPIRRGYLYLLFQRGYSNREFPDGHASNVAQTSSPRQYLYKA